MPIPFKPNATFRRAHAFALDGGLSTESRLIIELSDGLEDTPISWSYRSPSAATSVQYPATLESLRADEGRLVAVVGREHAWVPVDATGDAGSPEWVLIRGVITCDAGGALRCRAFFPTATSPSLGIKHKMWDAKTPWSDLAWDRAPSFVLSASGGLTIE